MITIRIFLDAETLPPEFSEEQMTEFTKNLSPPANFKDPVKIEKWLADNSVTKYRDLAKKSSSATVATLAYVFNNDEDIIGIFSEERDEKALLEAFYEDVMDQIPYDDAEDLCANYRLVFIGYNLRKFDLDLLWKRAVYFGLYDLAKLIPRERFSKNVIDIMEIFQGPNIHDYVSQDTVCKYFGLQGKPDDIDGSQVFDYWHNVENGKEKVMEYNKDDVDKVRQLYNIMVSMER
jgi:DNA polymerase elongation subunit (family B)